MDCMAILDSGNYAYKLCNALEKKGYVFEVVATPCQIAKGGCGHCIKFPEQDIDILISTGVESGVGIREIYRIIPMFNKNKYQKIYG